jgi:hypothetical protein
VKKERRIWKLTNGLGRVRRLLQSKKEKGTRMKKLDRHAVGSIASISMAAVAIVFCVKAEHASNQAKDAYNHMEKIEVIRFEQVKTDRVQLFNLDGPRIGWQNLMQLTRGVGEEEGFRAIAIQFSEPRVVGRNHWDIPKPHPTASPAASPAATPVQLAVK